MLLFDKASVFVMNHLFKSVIFFPTKRKTNIRHYTERKKKLHWVFSPLRVYVRCRRLLLMRISNLGYFRRLREFSLKELYKAATTVVRFIFISLLLFLEQTTNTNESYATIRHVNFTYR